MRWSGESLSISAPTRPGGHNIPSNPCLHSGGVKGDLMVWEFKTALTAYRERKKSHRENEARRVSSTSFFFFRWWTPIFFGSIPLDCLARLESPRASVVLLKSSGWSLHRFPRKEKALCLARLGGPVNTATRSLVQVQLEWGHTEGDRPVEQERLSCGSLLRVDGVVSSGFGSGHTASLVLGVSVWCGGLHFSPSRTSRPVGMFRSLAPGGARAGAWPCAALLFARTRGDLIGARRYQSLGRGRTEDAFDGRFGLHSDRPAPVAHPERTRWDPKDGELCLARTKSGETLMETAGRWPWKSESAKECVTTHLPKQLALKMDGAEASCLYSAVRAREAGLVRHEALTSRRVASVCAEGSGREPAWSRRRCRSWW
ncbi:hypothetical protein L1887_56922 [Cichorium endivia]|nr:hypothetical protein L1887_56922 [Cichorium endivia]